MPLSPKLLILTALLGVAWAHDAEADRKTVCSITVNSPDEQAVFRRSLPPEKFQFVELVEPGRPDWLASACRRQIRCDVLVISGHYDGGNEFFSDRIEGSEFLPVDEMARAACSDSCPGLFSHLKEVYLFGCNTLNPSANRSASAEIERSLVRSGYSQADAERLGRVLAMRHGESSRDRMRLIFTNVPAIYGFSSVAPVGPLAAAILNRHFQADGTDEVGSGRASSRLLAQFRSHAMVVTRGMSDVDPLAPIGRTLANSLTTDCQSRRSSSSSIDSSIERWRRLAYSSTASRNTSLRSPRESGIRLRLPARSMKSRVIGRRGHDTWTLRATQTNFRSESG